MGMDEEPVSPPPCPVDEAPQLLMSQTIEELAMQVVEETRSNSRSSSPVLPRPQDTKSIMNKSVNARLKDVKITIKEEEEDDSIPKTIFLSPVPAAGPSLIPLTVTEILDNDGHSGSGPSTLHMSGGGVYTTDSFLDASRGVPSSSKNSEPSRPRSVITSVITRTPPNKTLDSNKTLENLIKMYTAATKSKPTKEKPTSGGTTVCRIPQATIKLSDSLEITPIVTRKISPLSVDLSVTHSKSLKSVQDNLIPKASKLGNNKKRKRESSPQLLNSSSELVIEKIPRKAETISGRSHDEDHDQTYNCKLLISKTNPKKVKLDFGNGIELMLNKSLFKGLNLTGVDQKQKSSLKRKPLKSRKQISVTNEGLLQVKSDKKKSINVDREKTQIVITTDVDVPKIEEKDVKNNSNNETVTDLHEDENNPVGKISKIPTDIEAVESIGLHKLPSIISKPSFYSSLSSRKKLEKTI